MSKLARHIRNNPRLYHFIMTSLILLLFAFTLRDCAGKITVTNYDGWKNACELEGGVIHDGLCFDPSALVEVN